ncbi:MAG: GNAT family N-acetyltransferase [bacterium]|nr:GNAT family N-acetyltransferase [bacterium]
MNKIFKAKSEHLNDFLKMAMDLWGIDYNVSDLKEIFLGALQSEKFKILFLSVDNNIAAFIFLSIRSDYVEGSTSNPTGYVEGIYVKPEYRKLGISKQLLLEGEKWLKEKGCKQVGSDAYIDNKLSYDFHTSVGFEEAGRLVTFIKDIE